MANPEIPRLDAEDIASIKEALQIAIDSTRHEMEVNEARRAPALSTLIDTQRTFIEQAERTAMKFFFIAERSETVDLADVYGYGPSAPGWPNPPGR